jgi:V-type H+-transporting ATPase subunit d
MSSILSFEADRRTINITLNSFGTELSKEQRARLFPTAGRLYPAGNNVLAKADDLDTVRQVCESVSDYRDFFDSSPGHGINGHGDTISGDDESEDLESAVAAALERRFFEMEVHLNKQAFLQQFNYGVFYSYVKLREQEIRSITWIAECLAQQRRERMNEFVPLW